MQYKLTSMNIGCVACGCQLIPLSGSAQRETISISHENFLLFLKNFEFEKWSTLDFDNEEDYHHSMATSNKPTMGLLEKVNKGIFCKQCEAGMC